jgi:MFS family permease
VSPVAVAINSARRVVASFHPQAMPRLSRGHYRRELVAWMFLPIMLATVEGGVTGVIAKNAFTGAVSSRSLNLAVGVLAAAPAFANILSFVWAALSHGRHKIRFLVALQVLTAGFVACIAAAPRDAAGLVLLMVGVVGARMCWSGVVTIRATVWRANYPRTDRATLAGKLATVQAVMLTVVGIVVGAAMDHDENAFRWLYPLAAAIGLVGTWHYRGLRVRGHRALMRAEQDGDESAITLVNPLVAWRVVRGDRRFGAYMLCMFVFGFGNLMVSAPLIIMLRDRFGLEQLPSILITLSIPTLIMTVTIGPWSKLLDRVHIVHFRAVHSVTFVASTGAFLAGALLREPWLLYLGAVFKGVAFGGGVLGWNLGHHDFAPRHRASQYMGIHVSLTGLRGLIAPALAVLVYELLEAGRPGSGAWVLAVCLGLTVTGAVGFNVMARRTPRDPHRTPGEPLPPAASVPSGRVD